MGTINFDKIIEGLQYCGQTDCSPRCPYYGETRGGRSCRQWLCADAALALHLVQGKMEAEGGGND